MAGRFLLPSASLPLLLFPFSDSRFSSSLSFLRVPFSLSLSLSLSHFHNGWKPKVLPFNVVLRYESRLNRARLPVMGLWPSFFFLLPRYWRFISSRIFASLLLRWTVRSLDAHCWKSEHGAKISTKLDRTGILQLRDRFFFLRLEIAELLD